MYYAGFPPKEQNKNKTKTRVEFRSKAVKIKLFWRVRKLINT